MVVMESGTEESDGTSTGQSTGGPTRVLVVEDEHSLGELYRDWLRAEGYEAQLAPDAAGALDGSAEDADVVLLDRDLPDRPGREVLRELRGEGCEVPVAMLTAYEPDDSILELPFDGYRMKPVSVDDLRELVEELIRIRSFNEETRRVFQLASKKAAIERSSSEDELVEDERYQSIVERLERQQTAVQERLDEFEDSESAFRSLCD